MVSKINQTGFTPCECHRMSPPPRHICHYFLCVIREDLSIVELCFDLALERSTSSWETYCRHTAMSARLHAFSHSVHFLCVLIALPVCNDSRLQQNLLDWSIKEAVFFSYGQSLTVLESPLRELGWRHQADGGSRRLLPNREINFWTIGGIQVRPTYSKQTWSFRTVAPL